MNLHASGTTERRLLPGMPGLPGPHDSRARIAAPIRFMFCIVFVAALVLVPAVSASGDVPAGNASPEENSSVAGIATQETTEVVIPVINAGPQDIPPASVIPGEILAAAMRLSGESLGVNLTLENSSAGENMTQKAPEEALPGAEASLTEETPTAVNAVPRNAQSDSVIPPEILEAAKRLSGESPGANVTRDNITVKNITPEETPLMTANLTVEERRTLMEDNIDQGINCAVRRDYACALRSFESAHQMDPTSIAPLYLQSRIFVDMGNYTAALEKMDAAIAVQPGNANLWVNKGRLLNDAGRFTESGAYFDHAQQLNSRLRIPLIDRFPYNIGIKNLMFIVIAIGFSVLGLLFYVKECRE